MTEEYEESANSQKYSRIHSFRAPRLIVKIATQRVQEENDLSLSVLIAMLLESYALGEIDLPPVRLHMHDPEDERRRMYVRTQFFPGQRTDLRTNRTRLSAQYPDGDWE